METPASSLGWRVWISVYHPVKSLPAIELIATGTAYGPHYRNLGKLRAHHQHTIFQYTLSGRGFFSRGNQTEEVPAGTGFLSKAFDSEVEYGYPEDGKEPWEFLFVNLQDCDSLVRPITEAHGHVFRLQEDSPFMSWARGLSRLDKTTLKISQGEALLHASRLLGEILHSASANRQTSPAEELVQRAEALLAEANFLGQVNEMAEKLQVSREHLARCFREVRGHSPGDAIASRRVAQASELLINTSMSCAEIATILGYTDQSHFTRMFKKRTGAKPQQFRKRSIT
jgi:AraC family transcriptional regulator, arabinose operon regulatory protein